jgi:hypothetical protein
MAVGGIAIGTLALAAPAMAAGPSASVTPKAKLKNGQVVTVKYSGFPASTAVYALECSSKVATLAGVSACDISLSHVKIGKSSATGAGSFKYTVRTGTVGKGTCATVSTNCVLSVAANVKPAPIVVSVSIHFGK